LEKFLKEKFALNDDGFKQILVKGMDIFNFSNDELEERFSQIKTTYGIGDNSLKLIL